MHRSWNRSPASSSNDGPRWQQQQQPGRNDGPRSQQHQHNGQSQSRNPCITMHQPWASLLVHGIKRVEGRSWPAPLHGRLWIHAASRVPEPATIEAIESFYRELYSVDGVADLTFPEHYPVSVLLGSVNVVGCVKSEELVSWNDIPNGVRLEGLTDFCWLCEDPQKLVVPFEMRGWQRVYNLEKKTASAAERGLRPVQGPAPVKFPLPDPSDPGSLKPGVLSAMFSQSTKGLKSVPVSPSPSLTASIAGAHAAAAQFKKPHNIERQDLSGSSTGAYSFPRSEQPFQSSRTEQPLLSRGQHRLDFHRQPPSHFRPAADHMN